MTENVFCLFWMVFSWALDSHFPLYQTLEKTENVFIKMFFVKTNGELLGL